MTSELNDAQEVSCWHDAIAAAIAGYARTPKQPDLGTYVRYRSMRSSLFGTCLFPLIIRRCQQAATSAAAAAAAASAQQRDAMADSTYVATVSGTEFVLDRRYESVRCVVTWA